MNDSVEYIRFVQLAVARSRTPAEDEELKKLREYVGTYIKKQLDERLYHPGRKVRIFKDFDAEEYAATSSLYEIERVGLEGTIGETSSEVPEGKVPVNFFAGDLKYETTGTKDDPEDDDFLTLYIPIEVLEIID